MQKNISKYKHMCVLSVYKYKYMFDLSHFPGLFAKTLVVFYHGMNLHSGLCGAGATPAIFIISISQLHQSPVHSRATERQTAFQVHTIWPPRNLVCMFLRAAGGSQRTNRGTESKHKRARIWILLLGDCLHLDNVVITYLCGI